MSTTVTPTVATDSITELKRLSELRPQQMNLLTVGGAPPTNLVFKLKAVGINPNLIDGFLQKGETINLFVSAVVTGVSFQDHTDKEGNLIATDRLHTLTAEAVHVED